MAVFLISTTRYVTVRHLLPLCQKETQGVWLHRTTETGLKNEMTWDPEGTNLTMQEETEQQAGYVGLITLMKLSSGLINRTARDI